MMSAPREACRWRCYHEHCLAATEAAAAPRHHLYTALRRDTARGSDRSFHGTTPRFPTLKMRQRGGKAWKIGWQWVNQAFKQPSSSMDIQIQIVVVVKVLRVCTIHENWSRLMIIITKLKTPCPQLLMQSHLQPIITIIISPVS